MSYPDGLVFAARSLRRCSAISPRLAWLTGANSERPGDAVTDVLVLLERSHNRVELTVVVSRRDSHAAKELCVQRSRGLAFHRGQVNGRGGCSRCFRLRNVHFVIHLKAEKRLPGNAEFFAAYNCEPRRVDNFRNFLFSVIP